MLNNFQIKVVSEVKQILINFLRELFEELIENNDRFWIKIPADSVEV